MLDTSDRVYLKRGESVAGSGRIRNYFQDPDPKLLAGSGSETINFGSGSETIIFGSGSDKLTFLDTQ